ncbi:phosphatase PAP2 family protein [Actinosynnema sp. CS-041913]|uniref:phosphatase PAP2 family protein n=1 Tax=Actinosynnema sp. CS-041913 TaxID=3239917 RepID=UPI003D90F5BC
MLQQGVEDVPDVSAEWYLDVVSFAASTPEPVRAAAGLLTDAVFGVFAVALAFLWWRSSTPDRVRVLLAPVAVGLAYGLSEVVKGVWEVDRPCRVLGSSPTIVECPEWGDWSFPSNHATVAGAAAVAILWCDRRLGVVAVVVAVFAAASRVFVGAHYPHDVLAGLALGAAVAGFLPLVSRVVTPVVTRRVRT